MLRSGLFRPRLEARTTAMASWVYMLRCRDGSYYIGCTSNPEQRIGQHRAGLRPGYTATRLPVELVWAEEFQHIDDAIRCERHLKGWSRAKKEALIAGDYAAISKLASRARR